jgi:opacity protein-like surface antigen
MRAVCAIVSLMVAVGLGGRAQAIDLETFFHPPDFTLQFSPYAGVGVGKIHHTGYDPDRIIGGSRIHLEQWEWGGKALAGAQILKWASVETAFHYLNSSPFIGPPGNRPGSVPGRETSQAIAFSFLAFTKPLFPPWIPLKLFGRLGGAYKWISDDNGLGVIQRESGFAFLIGGGAEVEFGPHWFARFEYEYLSKIGTSRAVNVQHTPLTLSVGARF